MNFLTSRKLPLIFFLISAAAAFFLLFPVFLSSGIWVNDEGNRLITIQAYRDHGTMMLSDPVRQFFGVDIPGTRGYPEPYFIPVKNDSGDYRSAYTAVFPRLMSLIPGKGLLPLRLFCFLCTLGSMALVMLIAAELGLSPVRQAICSLLLLFGTPLLFYSGIVLEPALACTLACGTYYCLVKRNLSKWYLPLAGLIAGLIPLFREEGFIIAAACGLALILQKESWKKLVLYGICVCIPVIPLFIWNLLDSSNLFGMHSVVYHAIDTSGQSFFQRAWESVLFFFAHHNGQGLYTWMELTVFAVIAAGLLVPKKWRTGTLSVCTLLLCIAALSNLYLMYTNDSPMKFTVICQSLCGSVMFAVLPIVRARSFPDNKQIRFLLFVFAFSVIGISPLLNMQLVGAFWGPRHYLAVLPLAVILCAALPLPRKTDKTGFAILFCAAILSQQYGVNQLIHRITYSESIQNAVRETKTAVALTDVFWVPEELMSADKLPPVILLQNDDGLYQAEKSLTQKGIASFIMLTSPVFVKVSDKALDALSDRYEISTGKTFDTPALNYLRLQILHFNLKTNAQKRFPQVNQ